MIEVKEAIRGDGPQLTLYLDLEVYITRLGRMEKLRKFQDEYHHRMKEG